MKNFSVWSRSRLFYRGAGADPSRSEPESAPGPWPSGAGAIQKSGGSATLHIHIETFLLSFFGSCHANRTPIRVWWLKASAANQLIFSSLTASAQSHGEVSGGSVAVNPLVTGNFFSSNFLTKICGEVNWMNRLGNLKVQSRHSTFDHARGQKNPYFRVRVGCIPNFTYLIIIFNNTTFYCN